ncbi:MAG: hypothetical protein WC277_03850 [Bacilli bacterium]
MDRSRCTAILKAILDRNLPLWAPVALLDTSGSARSLINSTVK